MSVRGMLGSDGQQQTVSIVTGAFMGGYIYMYDIGYAVGTISKSVGICLIYVCAYILICICMYDEDFSDTYIYLCVYIYTYMYVCMYICICVSI